MPDPGKLPSMAPEQAGDPTHLRATSPMSKRNTKGTRLPRKRRKAGSSYAAVDLDVPDSRTEGVEDIRVWNITKSETTGRVSATRRNYQHIYDSLPEPLRGEPPVVEDINSPADPEASELLPAKSVVKRKRARKAKTKENDSVSSIVPPTELIVTRLQTRMVDWLAYCMIFLDELLRQDGLGDSATPGICVNCKELMGEYRCNDCFGNNMYCSRCIVSSHRFHPLHRLQVCSKLSVSWQLQ